MAAGSGIAWGGMQEFRALLQKMPTHLRDRAKDIVDHYTQITYSQVFISYPLGDSGNLRKGLKVEENITDAGVTNAVISTAHHSHLWEFGTVNRETEAGWKRGRMKSLKEQHRDGVIDIAIRNRKAMNRALVQMMVDDGFEVSGDLAF